MATTRRGRYCLKSAQERMTSRKPTASTKERAMMVLRPGIVADCALAVRRAAGVGDVGREEKGGYGWRARTRTQKESYPSQGFGEMRRGRECR